MLPDDFDLPLSNYYGTVRVEKRDEHYFMSLDDWNGKDEIEISQTLYLKLRKEFVPTLST